jgi:hypothetical protein
MKNILFLLCICVSLSSCSNYSAIVQKHKNDIVEPKIIPIADASAQSTKSFKIREITIDDAAITQDASFEKTKTFVLPLLVLNIWNHQTEYSIGKKQFSSSLEDHLRNAFEVGLTQFGYRKADDSADFEISIRVRKLQSKAEYAEAGHFYFVGIAYGYGYGERRGPYTSNILFDITTNQGMNKYTSEITAISMLDQKEFQDEIDPEINRINRSLEQAINLAIVNYSKVAPR